MGRFVSFALLAHTATATALWPATRAGARATPAFASPGLPARRRARASPAAPPRPPPPLGGSRAPSRRRAASALRAGDAAPPASDVLARLELDQQFERWRFFQRLLDGELPPADVEAVLAATLRAYLRHGPADASADNRNENGGIASPVLTAAGRRAMEGLVAALDVAAGDADAGRFVRRLVLPPVDYTGLDIDAGAAARAPAAADPAALAVLRRLEGLLPDPVEDEEAHTSAWDVVLSLHGREAVRLSETALQREREGAGDADGGTPPRCDPENLQWRTVCTAGRVLIHYDLLTKGVLEEGAFSLTSADAPAAEGIL